jgi:hypothetical protein
MRQPNVSDFNLLSTFPNIEVKVLKLNGAKVIPYFLAIKY